MPDIITSGLVAIERLLNDSDHAECCTSGLVMCNREFCCMPPAVIVTSCI